MRTMILAAVAATGLTGGVAYAGDGDVPSANTLFTQIPGGRPSAGTESSVNRHYATVRSQRQSAQP
jgi:hypothetical protein